ncbi:hypothetical protein RJT34_24638 [Clitoria ternatea]|uniref:Uncharacterized protein n=1 Tax=Clitoria ternatea TaxID=43366 RepID=A0AAN9FUI1_CLITE
MASLKAEKPVEKSSGSAGLAKKEPAAAKLSSSTPKASASKPKKTEPKSKKKYYIPLASAASSPCNSEL